MVIFKIYSIQYKNIIVTGLSKKICYKKVFKVEEVEKYSYYRDDEFFEFIHKYHSKNIDEYILRYFANLHIQEYMIKNEITILKKENNLLITSKGKLKYEIDFEKLVIYLNDVIVLIK